MQVAGLTPFSLVHVIAPAAVIVQSPEMLTGTIEVAPAFSTHT